MNTQTISEMIARLGKTNPWQVIEILQKENTLLDNQVNALRAEVVRLISELDATKKESASGRAKQTSIR